tara:strand:- start:6827 stop:7903 length:1077 start_codon:yes stop_codon:yes gene_type:complete
MAFKSLDPEDFVISSDSVTSTVWSNNSPALNTFFTSSTQTEGTSGPYYTSVYQTSSDDDTAAVQFQIAYANRDGGGGVNFDSSVPFVSPTTTIYGQYRTLILEDENSSFVWGDTLTGSANNDFYVISIERARYKQSLLPGTLNLVLSSSNTNTVNIPTLHLTDNSGMVTLPTYYGTQRVYQLISGSNGIAYNASSGETGFTLESGSYGWFCPDISTILLNAAALNDNTQAGGGINLATNTVADDFGNNPQKLYNHISGSIGLSGVDNVFELNSQETISSDYVFIRARNNEFNYTENPSFISGSTGEVIYPYFINNPQTFPTTVGMYNNSNDLLAVAKLSRPIQKDFTKEALIRVKLDF